MSSTTPARLRAVHVHTASGHPLGTRVVTVAAAVGTAVLVWFFVGPMQGVDLSIVAGGSPQTIGLSEVVVVSLGASLAGIVSLLVVQQVNRHPRGVWASLALAVTLLSLVVPLTADGPLTTRVGLATVHLSVGAVLIPGLALSIRSRYEPVYRVRLRVPNPRRR